MRNPIKPIKGRVGKSNNFMTFQYDLTKTIAKVSDMVARLEGTSPNENLIDVVRRLAQGCHDAVLHQFRETYSRKPRAVAYRARTSRTLEPLLDYQKVEQVGNVVHMQVTHPILYPLNGYNRGKPAFYTIFQEEGTRYVYARGFLLSGIVYLDTNAKRSVNAAFRRWSRA